MGFTRRPIAECVHKVSQIEPVSDPQDQFLYIDLSSIEKDEKRVVWEAVQELSWEEAPSRARQIVYAGDILVSTVRPNLNGVAQLEPSCERAIASTGFCVLRTNPDVLDPRYLFHWLCNPNFITEMVRLATGASYPAVSDRIIHESLIPLPSDLSEQCRIAAILDKADAVRKKRREALKLADEFLRSVFFDMFGDPVRNHKGWTQSTLGEIAPGRGEIVDGPFGSSLKPDQYVDEGIRVVRNFNVRPGYFDPSAFKYVTPQKFAEIRRSEVTEGDLLLSTKGTVGNVCLMPYLQGPSVLSATGTVRIRVSSRHIMPVFLMHQMLMPQYQRYIQENQAGAVQQYLNLSGIRDLAIILPPLVLQSNFAVIAKHVSQLIERSTFVIREAEALYVSLAHRAFSGKLQR